MRKLRIEDAARLLEFERDNRAWFEQFVEVRLDSFYSINGVQAHISEYLDESAHGVLYPCVLADSTEIGRASCRERV